MSAERTLWVVMDDGYDEPPTLYGAYRSEPVAQAASARADYCSTVRSVTVYADDEFPTRTNFWHGSASIRADGLVEPWKANRYDKVLWPGQGLDALSEERWAAVVVSGVAVMKWTLYLSYQPDEEAAAGAAEVWLDAKRTELGLAAPSRSDCPDV